MSRRMAWSQVLVLAAMVGVMAGCGVQNGNAAPAGKSSPGVTAKAETFPEFTVKTLDNQDVNLNRYRGKIVILDLFATWCPPCQMEIPHFVELQETYADKLDVVGLSYDQGNLNEVRNFIKKMKINYDVFWGSEEIAQHVGLRGIPHTLVLDPLGRGYRSYVGYRDKAVFEKDVQALIAKFPEAGSTPAGQPQAATKPAK